MAKNLDNNYHHYYNDPIRLSIHDLITFAYQEIHNFLRVKYARNKRKKKTSVPTARVIRVNKIHKIRSIFIKLLGKQILLR